MKEKNARKQLKRIVKQESFSEFNTLNKLGEVDKQTIPTKFDAGVPTKSKPFAISPSVNTTINPLSKLPHKVREPNHGSLKVLKKINIKKGSLTYLQKLILSDDVEFVPLRNTFFLTLEHFSSKSEMLAWMDSNLKGTGSSSHKKRIADLLVFWVVNHSHCFSFQEDFSKLNSLANLAGLNGHEKQRDTVFSAMKKVRGNEEKSAASEDDSLKSAFQEMMMDIKVVKIGESVFFHGNSAGLISCKNFFEKLIFLGKWIGCAGGSA